MGSLFVEFLAQLEEVLLDLERKSSFIMLLAQWPGVFVNNAGLNARWQRASDFPGSEL